RGSELPHQRRVLQCAHEDRPQEALELGGALSRPSWRSVSPFMVVPGFSPTAVSGSVWNLESFGEGGFEVGTRGIIQERTARCPSRVRSTKTPWVATLSPSVPGCAR